MEQLDQFKHIKLNSLLNERAQLLKNKDQYNDIQSSKMSTIARFGSPAYLEQNDHHLANALELEIHRDLDLNQKQARIQNTPNNTSDNFASLIYQSALSTLLPIYNNIGQQESQAIIDFRRQFDLGQMDFSGFNWQKAMGSYSIFVDRQVRPDSQNPSQWLVVDRMEFSIDAQTYLKKLVDTGLISLNSIGLDAFAGITFKRIYHFTHLANSYESGLSSDYSKLFLPFIQFDRSRLLNQAPYTLLKKEDFLTVKAAVSAETPPVYGFDLKGTVRTDLTRMASITAQALGELDHPSNDEYMRVSIDKKLSVAVGVNLDLQLDFFKLLKLTLLSYELEYQLDNSDQVHLSIYNADRNKLINNNELGREFKSVLSLANLKINHLEPFVVSSEQRQSHNLSSRFSALIYGKLKKSMRESVKIIKDQKVNQFFRETSENIAVVQSWLSRLWATVVFKLFEFESHVKNVAVTSIRYSAEYQAERAQTERFSASDKFSLTLDHEFYFKKTDGINKAYKKQAIEILDDSTNLEKIILDKIVKNEILGPMQLNAKLQLNQRSIDYFLSQDEDHAFAHFGNICGKTNEKWTNANQRKKELNQLQVGRDLCIKNLGKVYIEIKRILMDEHEYDLAKISELMKSAIKVSKSLKAVKLLFGENTSFLHGKFEAKTKQGKSFTSYFSHGTFDGLGVIEKFQRFNSNVAINY
jgi:hypothetical protein